MTLEKDQEELFFTELPNYSTETLLLMIKKITEYLEERLK